MFEKNISKVLDQNLNLFNYRIELDYDNLRRKNHHNVIFVARDDFKLESYDNLRIIENHLRKIFKLHYFRKIIFHDIFPEFEDNEEMLDIWVYRLKDILKMKHILRKEKHLLILLF